MDQLQAKKDGIDSPLQSYAQADLAEMQQQEDMIGRIRWEMREDVAEGRKMGTAAAERNELAAVLEIVDDGGEAEEVALGLLLIHVEAT